MRTALEQTWDLTADALGEWHSRAGLSGFATLEVQVATPARYAFVEALGEGGMGQVLRVRDRELARDVAMKVLHPRLAGDEPSVARFVAEANAMARIAHPGVVPVYQRGRLADDRPFFTMALVDGETLDQLAPAWPLRRRLEAWLRVARTVAHAHRLGFVHRDLKPANVMVGEHDDVLVMDWGLVKHVDAAGALGEGLTRAGAISGTPAWMAPEQAAGRTAEAGPQADVYALGAMLYEAVTGATPYLGALERAAAGERRATPAGAPLAASIDAALAFDPAARPSASTLGDAVAAWLDAEARREAALLRLAGFDVEGLRAERAVVAAEAEAVDAQRFATPSWWPLERKRPLWAREDALEERRAALAQRRWGLLTQARSALEAEPELPEGHAALAALHREGAEAAEAADDRRALRRELAALRRHDRAGVHAAWIRGDGALTLVTDPPARATVRRYVSDGGVLRLEGARGLGRTPLRAVALPRGSYLVELRADGCDAVRYPVSIGRQEHWDGVAPGRSEPTPIRLPRTGELGAGEVYVPAGWTRIGGTFDNDVPAPRLRVWVEPYAIDRHAVTFERYVALLNRLQDDGDADAVAFLRPRTRSGDQPDERTIHRVDGRWVPGHEPELDPTDPQWPMFKVTWHQAARFAELVGRSLPSERQWEKAGRGADARPYPWGDRLDPSLANVTGHREGVRLLEPVGAVPTDCSPYGVFDLAGNIAEWCADAVEIGTLGDEPKRACRGGAAGFNPAFSALGRRRSTAPHNPTRVIGFRTARSLPW